MESGPADPEREPSDAACDPAGNGEPGAAGEPASCRARAVLQRVGDKWSMYVIDLLGRGTMRFTELQRSIEGISQRMLTLTLRQLERSPQAANMTEEQKQNAVNVSRRFAPVFVVIGTVTPAVIVILVVACVGSACD